MRLLSQNKKILLSSISIFVVSLAVLLFFVDSDGMDLEVGHDNVLNLPSAEHKELQEGETLNYSRYLDSDDETWFVTNSSGDFLDLSEEFASLIDVEKEEIIGDLLFNYINAKDLPGIVSENSKLLQEAEEIEGLGPYRMLNDDNEEILVIFKAVPIIGDDKKVEEILFSVKDISEVVKEMHGSGGESAEEESVEEEVCEDGEEHLNVDDAIEDAEEAEEELTDSLDELFETVDDVETVGSTENVLEKVEFASFVEKVEEEVVPEEEVEEVIPEVEEVVPEEEVVKKREEKKEKVVDEAVPEVVPEAVQKHEKKDKEDKVKKSEIRDAEKIEKDAENLKKEAEKLKQELEKLKDKGDKQDREIGSKYLKMENRFPDFDHEIRMMAQFADK